MVRAHLKQTPDDKKDSASPSSSRAAAPKKKPPSDPSVWPCKIHGCNKVFMREADLKRHQRTTKSHTIPAFSCPQCDSSFTRTDALRRHQRSRHNGVIIEPANTSSARSESQAAESSASARSTSASASAEGTSSQSVAREASSSSLDSGLAGNLPPSPRKSHYRRHTMHPSYGAPMHLAHSLSPPTETPSGDTSSSSKGASSSSNPAAPPSGSKLPAAPQGFYPMFSPWAAGMPPGVIYIPSPYYAPSPYYRHPGTPLMPVPPYPGYPMPPIPPEYLSHYAPLVYPMYAGAPPNPPGETSSSASPDASNKSVSPPAEDAADDAGDNGSDGGSEDAEGEPDGEASVDADGASEDVHDETAERAEPPLLLESTNGASDTVRVSLPDEPNAVNEELEHDSDTLMLSPTELLTLESLSSPS